MRGSCARLRSPASPPATSCCCRSSVWSGADAATRDLFHWMSAAIALAGCLPIRGRVFFRSAWQALRRGRTNMDVPISIGVLLAFGMSLYETRPSRAARLFRRRDSLLFFLLIGRTLDHVMRERARTAVEGTGPAGAARRDRCVEPDGRGAICRSTRSGPGMAMLLAAGDRVPVDGVSSKGAPISTARW